MPLPCLLLFLESTSAKVASLALGSLLGLTDYADGLLARRLRKKSFLGALLDPVADKIFITSVFLILSYLEYVSYPLVFLLIFRELIVAVMRSLFPEDLRVVGIARLKTLLQMLFAGIIISVNAFVPSFSHLSDYLLATVVFISYLSAIPYFYRFSKALFLKHVPLFAFLRSFSTLLYPISLLILFPNAGKFFFIPIVALNLYIFRNGLAKVIPFREKGENFFYFLAALGGITEYLLRAELFFSLILVLVISFYKDGLKSAKIIWDILRLR